MANERLILAIGHMERALSRLETAEARLGDETIGNQHGDEGDLAHRHELLKSAAAEALAGIDALIAGKG